MASRTACFEARRASICLLVASASLFVATVGGVGATTNSRGSEARGVFGTGPIGVATTTPPSASEVCEGPGDQPSGPDGFGGCWPGPTSTGVPPGVALTEVNGDLTIT